MVKKIHPNLDNTKLIKSSWAKDYVVLIIGLTLVLLSNFSTLNKDTERQELITTEENVSLENSVIVKGLTTLARKDS